MKSKMTFHSGSFFSPWNKSKKEKNLLSLFFSHAKGFPKEKKNPGKETKKHYLREFWCWLSWQWRMEGSFHLNLYFTLSVDYLPYIGSTDKKHSIERQYYFLYIMFDQILWAYSKINYQHIFCIIVVISPLK